MHFPFREKRIVFCQASFLAILCDVWLERKSRICRDVGKSRVEVWELVSFNASIWASVTKPFCKYDTGLVFLGLVFCSLLYSFIFFFRRKFGFSPKKKKKRKKILPKIMLSMSS